MLEEKDLQAIAQLMDQKLGQLNQKVDDMDKRLTDRLDRVEDRAQRTAVLLEGDIDRKLDLLYEGHDTLMEQFDRLASRSRVEELESDVALLKDSVKLMRLEIEALQKAQ